VHRLFRWASAGRRVAILCLALAPALATAREYGEHPAARAFAAAMAEKHGFERSALQRLFAQVHYQDAIVKAMERPAERVKPWYEYRQIFLTERRIREGVEFWRDHRSTLERAQRDYGVDPGVVVAIIGVETFYGRITGSFRVVDALATLAFDYPKRSAFFTRELEHYLLLAREQGLDPLALKGSYAGAMGYGQFIPSSYRTYAVDYDGDGIADIWNNPVDAIASVANYFARHGWRQGAPVAVPAVAGEPRDTSSVNALVKPAWSLEELSAMGYRPAQPIPEAPALPLQLEGAEGDEYWLAFDNFYVITRYNHSHRYAMAVYQLSQAISDRISSDE